MRPTRVARRSHEAASGGGFAAKVRSAEHVIGCPYCQTEFDLFAAHWCEHIEAEPSKVCPGCNRCLCDHPAYAEPLFWKEAPSAFQAEGFGRLFLFYL